MGDMIKWASAHQIPDALMETTALVPAIGQQLATQHHGGGEEAGLTSAELNALWAIPCQYEQFPETEGICLTGNTQLKWIGQCVRSKVRFVISIPYRADIVRILTYRCTSSHRYALHIDGKHKLHHGKWIMVSIGCHDIRFDKHRNRIVHSYRPMVYQFVKQQESRESVKMLCTALDLLAYSRFGLCFSPGVVNMDHSNGFRQGVLDVWPNTGYHVRTHI